MKRITMAIMMIAIFSVPSSAMATNNTPPGNGPPELCDAMPWLPQCDDGSDVEIDDPTNEECSTGGIVLVVDGIRYPVCNGTNGQDGENGENGAPGMPGPPGPDGQTPTLTIEPTGENCANGGIKIMLEEETFYVCNGINGKDGTDGTNGLNGTNGTDGGSSTQTQTIIREVVIEDPEECVSNETRKFTIKKPKSGDSVRKLKVWFEGNRIKAKRTANGNWTVKVKFQGLTHGTYAVRVHALTNRHQFRHMHYFRVCYGNVAGGVADSLNAFKYVRLR